MKTTLFAAMALLALSLNASAETASCTVESTGEQGVSRKTFEEVKRNASADDAVSYEFSYADGSQGQFSLMSVADAAGAEADDFVSVSGYGRDECKEEILFSEGADGEPVRTGVETVCPNGSRHALTVTCSF